MRSQIQYVRCASLRWLLCCFRSKRLKILNKGEDRIAKKLDIVRLYKHQMTLDLAYKILFSKRQRKLIKQSREFALDSESSAESFSDGFAGGDFDHPQGDRTLT